MSSSAVKTSLLVVTVLAVLATTAVAAVNRLLDREDVRTFAITEPVRSIVVNAGDGDVHLVPAGDRVAVRETRHFVTEKPTLDRDVRDGVLTLASHCGNALLRCSADLRVTVPAGAEVTVQTDSGDVDADGVDLRDAQLRSDSGNVRAELAGGQELVWARTDSGDVTVIAPGARAVDAQTDSGDVKVAGGDRLRRIVAQTDSGDVEVAVPGGAYAIDADTDSGDVAVDGLSRDDRAPRAIEARTDSGDVKLRPR
jgi:archaeosine-15-forming tRNA-guanine transglycosylase